VSYTDSPLTLTELIAALAEDLRDANKKTFDDTNLTQYINDGIVEVNRVYPLQVIDTVSLVEGTSAYDTRFSSAYRVEVWDGTDFLMLIPHNDSNWSQAGWDLMGTVLHIPASVVSAQMFAAYTSLTLHVSGYARRQLLSLSTPSTASELDSEAALAVRWFAQYRAFMALMSDRTLYKQWQGQSNNTDTSMPMLMNAVSTASQMWERQRRRLVTYRRSPVGDPVVL